MAPPETLPDIAPDHCTTCRSAKMIQGGLTHRDHALYHCGTTTLMLREGWHNDGRDAGEKNRTLALWRQTLLETGRSFMDDPMLADRARLPRPAPLDAPAPTKHRTRTRRSATASA